jgi:hypothetical protein
MLTLNSIIVICSIMQLNSAKNTCINIDIYELYMAYKTNTLIIK